MAQLLLSSFPSTTPFKCMKGCHKESYHDREVISLWATCLHSTKNLSGTVPNLDPAEDTYLSSTQRAGDSSCPAYNTFVCTAQHSICSLCNAATQLTHGQFGYQALLCRAAACPVPVHFPLTHLVTLSKPNTLHLSWLNCIRRYLMLFCQLVTSFKCRITSRRRFTSRCYGKFI